VTALFLLKQLGLRGRRSPPMSARKAAKTVALSGERSLFFCEEGDGPPLVLIHGALTTHADWRPDLRLALSRHHRVLTIDRPGHGRSIRPRFSGSPRKQARQIREGLALGSPAIVVAHSNGAMAALAWAEQYPSEVSQLILVAPLCMPEVRLVEHTYLAPRASALFGPFLSEMARLSTDRAFFAWVSNFMFSPAPVPAAWRGRLELDLILGPTGLVAEGEDFGAMSPFSPDAHLQLTRVCCPITIIVGNHDAIIRHERQGLALAALKDARLIRAPGLGHMVHELAPELIFEAIGEHA
jgi:pimeloyl-ACP methyl ester carboxylesterase